MGYSKLKGYRTMANLTQEDVSKQLGLSRTIYNGRENGNSKFTPKEMLKIKNILNNALHKNLTIDEIFF